jgi:hypothetical protein
VSLRGVSVKKLAKDIADGHLSINQATLKKYQPQELKMLLTNLTIVQREYRAERVEENDFDAVKKKNWRVQNLTRATLVINTFIKHRRIKVN